ncbi:M23 family metallopeptidase [Leucobacter sp. USHLN153]|uniref:M23 family metallopeptidase n=1 Tax=Leucobacter sp. USHLN153 TaxID=3081268 RepID=UPI003019FA09
MTPDTPPPNLDGTVHHVTPAPRHRVHAEPSATPSSTTRRSTAARVVAGVSAGGLLLALALPLAGQQDGAPVAAVQQQLFSEVSADDLPSSLADIEIVDSDTPAAVGYSGRARSVVNYPFASPEPLTDPFGYRTAPVAQFHDAQDFGAAAGTEILIVADGVVREAGPANDGCGFGLTVAHEIDGHEVTSRYCHMEDHSHAWSRGDTVQMGDHAGRVGATGLAFGAHLHLAIRVDDEPVDPMPFLAKYYHTDRGTLDGGSLGHADVR